MSDSDEISFSQERRREPRLVEDLPIRIWAVDERGLRFTQTAIAHNISRTGALLIGLERKLRCGDLIWVQYVSAKARFRIVWLRDSQGPYKVQAAVQRLTQDECPWDDVLAGQTVTELP